MPRLSQCYMICEEMALSGVGLHRGQPAVLEILSKVQEVSQKELGQMLDISAPTVTMMLRRMEKNGLVERKADGLDQRVQRVSITEKGREAAERAAMQLAKLQEAAFWNFTQEERRQATAYMARLVDNLQEYRKGENDASL